MPVHRAAEQRRDRQPGDLPDDVPQRGLERPVPAGMEVDRLEDPDVAGDRQRILRRRTGARTPRSRPSCRPTRCRRRPRRSRPARSSRRTCAAAPGPRPPRTAGRAGSASRSRRMPVIRIVRSIAHRRRVTASTGFVDTGRRPPVPFRDLLSVRAEEAMARTGSSSRERRRRVLVACPLPAGGIERDGLSQVGQGAPSTTPLQLDVVEAFAKGRLSRREFIQRGTIVGLSMGSISAVIAACGGATPSGSAAASVPASAGASGPAALDGRGRHDPGRRPATGGPLDPVAMHRPRRATASPPSRSSSCAPWTPERDRHRAGPRRRSGRRMPTTPSGRSSSARASRGITTARRSRRPMSSRRWIASSPPATPASRASSTRVPRSRPTPTR